MEGGWGGWSGLFFCFFYLFWEVADWEREKALADFIKYSTNSSLALNPISLLILASEAFQASASPVWLEISAGILVKLKKEDEESIGRPVEVELEIVLRGVSDLNCEFFCFVLWRKDADKGGASDG